MDWNTFRSSVKGLGLSQQEISKKYKEMKSSIPNESITEIKESIETKTEISGNIIKNPDSEKYTLLSEYLDFVNFKLNRTDNKVSEQIKEKYYNTVKLNSVFKCGVKLINPRTILGNEDTLSEALLVLKYKGDWVAKQIKEIVE